MDSSNAPRLEHLDSPIGEAYQKWAPYKGIRTLCTSTGQHFKLQARPNVRKTMSFINFESAKTIEDKRDDIRKARNSVLKMAEEKFHRKKEKEERAKRRGEDKWMLPSLERRLEGEGKDKQKKHKKKKKKKRKRSTDSSSSEESGDEVEWVEKRSESMAMEVQSSPAVVERDEWMNMPIAVPTVGIEEARGNSSRKRDEEIKKAEQKTVLDQPGKSSRELNPYWRDGGSGLPSAGDGQRAGRAAGGVGDRGAGWLRRALQRVEEQAAEQGRTPEEVAAEHWGSLKKLESMLAAAEGHDAYATDKGRSRRERCEQNGRREREKREFRKPGEGVVGSHSRVHNSTDRRWKKGDAESRDIKKLQEQTRRRSRQSSSSSSESEHKEANERAPQEPQPLSDKELNDLGARLVKAEIMGNESLAAELKRKLEQGRAMRTKPTATTSGGVQEQTVVLTKTGSGGLVHPLQPPSMPESSAGRRKRHKVDTHVDGKRVRFFADDDKFTLQDMFEREKLTTVDDQNEMFSKMAAKGVGRTESERDMDDMFEERARLKESEGMVHARERSRAIAEHKRSERALDNCALCIDSKLMLKHLLVAIGSKVYLSLPPHQSLTEGHCLVAPIHHVPCATQLDEDVWAEVQSFRKVLTAMFKTMDQDVVFFETAMHLRHFPHMALHCVPMPRETGDLAPIFFKKAILECETEWASNKKLVDLAGKDVRRAVPKGLPYFAVDFGLQSGFAHVIEDEQMFPKNFAQEIIGGMLDLDHSLWRKQRRENFDAQRKKVVQFAKWWKPFDFTHKGSRSDSDSD